jgi:hypothetical protein
MLIDHITTETVTKGRIFSEDGTTTDNGSAMVAHASVGTYGTDGAITPTSASGFGGGNQTRYTFTIRNTLPDGVYNLALFRTAPAIGGAFKLLPFRVYAGALIPIQGGENVTITSRSVSPTPYSRSQVDQKISGTGVSAALLNAVNNASGFAVFDANGNLVGNWIPSNGTKATIDQIVGEEGQLGRVLLANDTGELRMIDEETAGGISLTKSRVLYESFAIAGNATDQATDLHSFTVPAKTLRLTGESLLIEVAFNVGDGSTFNHTAIVNGLFGDLGLFDLVFGSSDLARMGRCEIKIRIVRVSATEANVHVFGAASVDLGTLSPTGFNSTDPPLQNLTPDNLDEDDLVFKLVAEDTGGTSNYVRQHLTKITWFAAPMAET